MRARATIALICLTMMAAIPASHVTATSEDWVLAVATIDPGGAFGMTFRLTGHGHALEGRNPVAGDGFSWRNFSTVSAASFASTRVPIRTSSDVGGIDITVHAPIDDGSFDFEYTFTIDNIPLAAGEEIAILAFFPDAAIETSATDLTSDSGSATVDVRSGSGSAAVRVADPEKPGPGVAIGPFGAAVGLARTTSVADGLVGAFNIEACEGYCEGSWQGPDVEGSFTQIHPHAVYGAGVLLGTHWFSGAGGSWEVAWTGSAFSDEIPARSLLANPVVVAWAPIGPDNRLFPVPLPRGIGT